MNTPEPQISVNGEQIAYVTMEPQYVTGLAESSASFTYSRTPSGIRLRFTIKLPEADKPLVLAIQRFLGVGGVYLGNGQLAGRTWQFCVTRRNELRRIVSHFDTFPLLGRKAEQYRIWKQILELALQDGATHREESYGLAAQLSQLSTRRHGRSGIQNE